FFKGCRAQPGRFCYPERLTVPWRVRAGLRSVQRIVDRGAFLVRVAERDLHGIGELIRPLLGSPGSKTYHFHSPMIVPCAGCPHLLGHIDCRNAGSFHIGYILRSAKVGCEALIGIVGGFSVSQVPREDTLYPGCGHSRDSLRLIHYAKIRVDAHINQARALLPLVHRIHSVGIADNPIALADYEVRVHLVPAVVYVADDARSAHAFLRPYSGSAEWTGEIGDMRQGKTRQGQRTFAL